MLEDWDEGSGLETLRLHLKIKQNWKCCSSFRLAEISFLAGVTPGPKVLFLPY